MVIPLENPTFLFTSKQILEIVCCMCEGGGAVRKYWITGVLGKNAELWVSHSGKHSYLYTLIVQIKVNFFLHPPSLKTYQSSKGNDYLFLFFKGNP